MADSIVRLRVESQEFEQKLKRASQELLAMADNARRTGATFAIADKEELAFVASLGQLQTSARSAKGTIAEMTKAFQDLSVHYRSLTAEEKAAPYGRELKKSLEELRQRINDGKASLNEINSSIGESKQQTSSLSSVVNDLTGKLGLNIPKLGAMSLAIGAVTTALKVAKDAFFSNEQMLDEWGRTTESAKSVYRGFLDALNTGDISGYLSRINDIVNAARTAYDALDELGTYNAFNQVNSSRNRQKFTNAIADYREGKGSKQEVQAAANAILKELGQTYQKQAAVYDAKIKETATQYGVSEKKLKAILTGDYETYQRAKAVQPTGVRYTAHSTPTGWTYTTTEKYPVNEAERTGAALRSFNDTSLKELQGFGSALEETNNQMGQVRRQLARVLGQTRVTGSGGGGGRSYGGGGSAAPNLDFLSFSIDESFNGGLLPDQEKENLSKAITKGMATFMTEAFQKTDPDTLKRLMQGESKGGIFDGADMSRGQQQKKGGDQTMNKIAKGVGAIGQITGSLQNLGLKLPDGVAKAVSAMQALINIIQTIQSVITVFSTGSQTANTVAVTANTAAVGALATAMTVNTASNFLPFSHGGIARAANGFIGGNRYSGDLFPVAVNSGELILNRAQQGNLASQLSGGAMGAIEVFGRISGEDIVLSSRRRNRRMYGNEITNNG